MHVTPADKTSDSLIHGTDEQAAAVYLGAPKKIETKAIGNLGSTSAPTGDVPNSHHLNVLCHDLPNHHRLEALIG